MPYSLMLDVLVAILLGVTIGYAIVLNKRLGNLRRDKEDLEKLALSFGDATARAESSINQLTTTTQVLQDRIEKAESLRDDLVFLIDRGGSAADRLEISVRAARDEAGIGPGTMMVGGKAKPDTASTQSGGTVEKQENGTVEKQEPASSAEKELLRAIRSAG